MLNNQRASPVSVICLGEILYDLIADQSDRSIEQVTSWTTYAGGAPANVACGLRKLGINSAFIGCVGKDQPGEQLIALLDALGVDTTGVQYHPTLPTRQVYVTRDAGGDRHFAGFGGRKTTDFADTALNADLLPENLWKNADYLVMGTLGLAYPPARAAMMRALQLAKIYGVKVLIDINWRPVFWPNLEAAPDIIRDFIVQADLLKCSEEEAAWLFGTDNPGEISSQYPNLVAILVTGGAKGCKYHLGKNSGTVEAFPGEVVDTTGAGDGFVAGFLARAGLGGDQIGENADLARKAVIYACAVGTMVTRGAGAIASQPTREQVEEFLAAFDS
ncbi:MAG: carbohydrate kinase [Microcystis sp. M49629_WE12]|nr:carbohydrate kinase [Microcystis sp. M49629_WE12]